MARMIYDYTKEVLERVSFNPDLFTKELKKAVKNLLPYEMEHLRNWLNFFTVEKPELKQCILIVKRDERK
jgi:predicted SprT family Zn-dependent metalloprotease